MYALIDDTLTIVSEYIDLRDQFYELFPEILKLRVQRDYDHSKHILCGRKHSLNDEPYEEKDGLYWYRFGELHRDFGPAKITIHAAVIFGDDNLSHQDIVKHVLQYEYYYRGLRHRTDGPAKINHNYEAWYAYDELIDPPERKRFIHSDMQITCIPSVVTEMFPDRSVWNRESPEEKDANDDEWLTEVYAERANIKEYHKSMKIDLKTLAHIKALDPQVAYNMKHTCDKNYDEFHKKLDLCITAQEFLGLNPRRDYIPDVHTNGAIKRRAWVIARQDARAARAVRPDNKKQMREARLAQELGEHRTIDYMFTYPIIYEEYEKQYAKEQKRNQKRERMAHYKKGQAHWGRSPADNGLKGGSVGIWTQSSSGHIERVFQMRFKKVISIQ